MLHAAVVAVCSELNTKKKDKYRVGRMLILKFKLVGARNQ
jgi:hypothetical protein